MKIMRWLAASVMSLALTSLMFPSRYGSYQSDVRELKRGKTRKIFY